MGGAPLAVGSGMDQSHVTSHVTMVNIKIAGICGKMWEDVGKWMFIQFHPKSMVF